MKIKTVVFWILWVGNDFTLQTVGERNDQLHPVFADHLIKMNALELFKPREQQTQSRFETALTTSPSL
jgi:hypothetical protein